MKVISKLKLSQISKEELAKRQLYSLRGGRSGSCCSCTCGDPNLGYENLMPGMDKGENNGGSGSSYACLNPDSGSNYAC